MAQKYYITTAIAYTSSKPHIGNTYEIVLADVLARFKRNQGFDVFFQTGTDEHGEKIELKAKEKGISPQKYVDSVAGEIKRIWDLMNTSYDNFVRTTDPYHKEQVQKIFKRLFEQGDIYKGTYKGRYCTPCESFWTESQLVDGKCPDCGREVQFAEEEAYFFNMKKYQDKLRDFYAQNVDFLVPHSRKNEMLNNFIIPGIQDLCVSRTSFTWGVPVSFDNKHVVYVWLDALNNYITGLGYDADGNHDEKFNKYWPCDVHVIGKDIVRFHSIYWPIFLMALGVEPPKQIFGHPWLLQDGGKMSKSKGNVIYADDLVDFFSVDPVRYFLLSQMPFDNDGVISWEIVGETINSELANVYGNLANRTVAMINKYFGGVIENPHKEEPVDNELISLATALKDKVIAHIDAYKTADALQDIFTLFRRANKYIDETTPWILAKDESQADRLKTVLYNLSEAIIIGSSLLEPFMPDSCRKIIASFGATVRAFDDLDKFGLLSDGTKVEECPEVIFKRLDIKEIVGKVDKMYESRKVADKPKANDKTENVVDIAEIGIEDFAKVQLRVGEILTAEKVEKADKLLKFSVKVGDETRTIVSGIAKHYTPDEMIGKQVVVVSNLKPAKLRGIESQGMLLCACVGDQVVLVSPEKRVECGAQVR